MSKMSMHLLAKHVFAHDLLPLCKHVINNQSRKLIPKIVVAFLTMLMMIPFSRSLEVPGVYISKAALADLPRHGLYGARRARGKLVHERPAQSRSGDSQRVKYNSNGIDCVYSLRDLYSLVLQEAVELWLHIKLRRQ
jgi:hypothetical protein